jgi:transposase
MAGIVATGEWLIHRDNSPAHTALRIRLFFISQGMTLVPHSPYSPDLAPADFFCSPNEQGLERAAI